MSNCVLLRKTPYNVTSKSLNKKKTVTVCFILVNCFFKIFFSLVKKNDKNPFQSFSFGYSLHWSSKWIYSLHLTLSLAPCCYTNHIHCPSFFPPTRELHLQHHLSSISPVLQFQPCFLTLSPNSSTIRKPVLLD